MTQTFIQHNLCDLREFAPTTDRICSNLRTHLIVPCKIWAIIPFAWSACWLMCCLRVLKEVKHSSTLRPFTSPTAALMPWHTKQNMIHSKPKYGYLSYKHAFWEVATVKDIIDWSLAVPKELTCLLWPLHHNRFYRIVQAGPRTK